jgi:hypothetical protein
MTPEAARTARELQMLEGLVDCAHGLALAVGAAAKAQTDTRRCLDLVDAFHKCGLSVRMGIRLCMTLRAGPKAALAVQRAEPVERDPVERDRPERGEAVEREREREYEPVSLPKFLSTLGVVARDAARLGDRLPEAAARVLPTLQNLLAEASPVSPAPSPSSELSAPDRGAGVAVLARPPQGATRHKLLGSAATSLPRAGPRAPPPWSRSG